MKRTLVSLVISLLPLITAAQVTIDESNWPYGPDQIGNNWQYYNTNVPVAVSIATINPFQQGGAWDFTTGPTSSTASTELMLTSSAPQPPPANTSYVERQMVGSATQWLYEDEETDGTWGRGVYAEGSIYAYNAPQYHIYNYPMTYATTWNSHWIWGQSIADSIVEDRENEIVGWGTVTVPFGGPLSCLVMRTLQNSTAWFIGIPIAEETYILYEWIVPGIGSVTTIQSQSGETNQFFTQAAGFYRLHNTNLGGDLLAPEIADATILTDTPYPGPYSITATITDASGIDSAAILYSINGGAYVTAGPADVDVDTFSFEIPMLTGVPVQEVRYYIWARDASTNGNTATDPAGAPASYHGFDWINDNAPPVFSDVTAYSTPTNSSGPFPVEATITDDNGVLFSSLFYRFGAASYVEIVPDSVVGDIHYFTIPAISATTIIRYYLEAVDNSGFFNTGSFPAAGASGPIIFQAVPPPADPKPVVDLTVIGDGADAVLNWSAVTEDVEDNPIVIDEYHVYRGTSSDDPEMVLLGTVSTPGYTDGNAVAGNSILFYSVRAVR